MQRPLSALTGGSKNQKLKWNEASMEAFEELKKRMKEVIQLEFTDYSDSAEKLDLWVNASQVSAGACLTQEQDGVYRVEYVLKTDQQPLAYLYNMRLVDNRLARTLEDLADFNFVIRYTPERLNVAADTLSRLKPILEASDKAQDNSSVVLPTGLTCDGAPVPGGGNSLFEVLLKALRRVIQSDLPDDHIALRKTLVDEHLMHSERYYREMNTDLRKQLRLMKIINQLPALEVLLAASFKFHVNFEERSLLSSLHFLRRSL